MKVNQAHHAFLDKLLHVLKEAGVSPEQLVAELARRGIAMDEEVITTHFIENNKIPAGFMADADDMAPMAALLCSPLSRFIVGQNIVIDGGQHHSLF